MSLCNKCGGSRIPKDCPEPNKYGTEVLFHSGYFSEDLPDGYRYEFELCEPCVSEFMKSFKIPPTVTEYL